MLVKAEEGVALHYGEMAPPESASTLCLLRSNRVGARLLRSLKLTRSPDAGRVME
jgi:hypothetical protein